MALDRDEIKAIIPHREPFLLVDRIESFVPGESAVGYLDVTADMFWVPGHFPEYAVMPGVLIVEACAQVGAVALLSLPENVGRIAFFGGIDVRAMADPNPRAIEDEIRPVHARPLLPAPCASRPDLRRSDQRTGPGRSASRSSGPRSRWLARSGRIPH